MRDIIRIRGLHVTWYTFSDYGYRHTPGCFAFDWGRLQVCIGPAVAP